MQLPKPSQTQFCRILPRICEKIGQEAAPSSLFADDCSQPARGEWGASPVYSGISKLTFTWDLAARLAAAAA